jgi:hypothetical protein
MLFLMNSGGPKEGLLFGRFGGGINSAGININ